MTKFVVKDNDGKFWGKAKNGPWHGFFDEPIEFKTKAEAELVVKRYKLRTGKKAHIEEDADDAE